MPERPENRQIERLLRAYGRKRQAEAGSTFALHPATRRMLLDEARRVHGPGAAQAERSSRRWRDWLNLSWPRLATAAALFLALSGAIWFSFRPEPDLQQVAKAESQPQPSAVPAPAPVPASPQPAPESPFDSAPAPAPAPVKEALPPELVRLARPSRTAAEPRPDIATEARALRESLSLAEKGVPRLEASQPATTPAPAVRSVARPTERYAAPSSGGEFSNLLAFAGTDSTAIRGVSPAPPASTVVLRSFSVSQAGDRIRLLDSDGSIYTGRVVSAGARGVQAGGVSDERVSAVDRASTAFRASGTNLTLKKWVVVEAALQLPTLTNHELPELKVQPLTLSSPAARSAPSNEPSAARQLRPSPDALAGGRLPWQIEGQATVGSNQSIRIRAVRHSTRP